jgi:O-antigen ligase/tetratricopeptide (TPR) repeat protein
MQNTYKNLALWTAKIALFAVPIIPLYIAQGLFFPYITGKAFIFRALVELAFFAWLFLAIFYKEYRPQKNSLLLAVSAWIGVVVLATIFSANPFRSFWSNFERMEGLVAYLHHFAYFLVLGHVFTKKDWLVFFNVFVIAGVYENFYGFLQWLGKIPSPQGGFRVDGTIGNPTYLSAYLTFIAGFCALLWMNAKHAFAKYFYVFVGAWSLLTIYFTATRGAYVSLLAGAFVGAVLYLLLVKAENDRQKLFKKVAIAGLFLAVLLPVGLRLAKDASPVRSNPVLSRLASISFSDAATRLTIWQMGLKGAQDRPILGWGPEGFIIVFPKYYQPSLYGQEPWFDRSHNIIIDWLINAGILGLISYLAILYFAVYTIWREYKKNNFSPQLAILLWVLILVYFVQNLFVFDQIATYIGFFALLAYIHSAAIADKKRELAGKVSGWNINSDGLLAATILLALLVPFAYTLNVRPYLANRNLLNALKLQGATATVQDAYQSYEKALVYNTLGNQEIREQFARFAISIGGSSQFDASFRDQVLRRAIAEAERGVTENNLDPRAYLFLGMVYGRVGLNDQAIQVLNKALELSPEKQQIYFELADAHLKKEDYAGAVRILEKTFNAEPRFRLARMNLAAAYILNGEQGKADQLLLEEFGTVNVADQILTQAYSAVQDYGRLRGIWQAFVDQDPFNTQYRVSLAGAHLLLGMKEEAISQLEEAIRLDPSFKAQGEAYIQQIRNQ